MLPDSEKIYTEITEYCDFADHLTEELEKDDDISHRKKRDILFPLIRDLKKNGNELVDLYVIHLKDKKDKEIIEKLKESLQAILTKIDCCKNKVYELYKTKEIK